LLLLAVFMVGTFVLLVWFVASRAREGRREMERRKAQENVQSPMELRDSSQPASPAASPAPSGPVGLPG
jgi:hypothetical protein